MKKLIAVLLSIMLITVLCACSNETTSETETEMEVEETVELNAENLTDEALERLVANALYDAVGESFDGVDPGSCRYSINSVDKSGSNIHVYGEVDLYNKYGKLTTGRRDGSGTAFRVFDVSINKLTFYTTCDIR